MSRSSVWLGDVIRAWASLDPPTDEMLRALTRTLGFELVRSGSAVPTAFGLRMQATRSEKRPGDEAPRTQRADDMSAPTDSATAPRVVEEVRQEASPSGEESI